MAADETRAINEQSTMNRTLCVRLVDFGDGLQRDVNITLNFVPEGFATQGRTEYDKNLGEICLIFVKLKWNLLLVHPC